MKTIREQFRSTNVEKAVQACEERKNIEHIKKMRRQIEDRLRKGAGIDTLKKVAKIVGLNY